jgi:hypothetical protein
VESRGVLDDDDDDDTRESCPNPEAVEVILSLSLNSFEFRLLSS